MYSRLQKLVVQRLSTFDLFTIVRPINDNIGISEFKSHCATNFCWRLYLWRKGKAPGLHVSDRLKTPIMIDMINIGLICCCCCWFFFFWGGGAY